MDETGENRIRKGEEERALGVNTKQAGDGQPTPGYTTQVSSKALVEQ